MILDVEKPEENHSVFKSAKERLKCPSKNDAQLFCCSEVCSKYAAVCTQKQCQACKTHKRCFKIDIQAFHENIEANVVSKSTSNRLTTNIENIFDKMIDSLSDLREATLKKVKNLGLSQTQQSYIEFIDHQLEFAPEQKIALEITGKKIYRLNSESEQKRLKYVEPKLNEIKKEVQESLLKVIKFSEKISKTIEDSLFEEITYQAFANSQIIEKKHEQQFLLGQLERHSQIQVTKVQKICQNQDYRNIVSKIESKEMERDNIVLLIENSNHKRYGLFLGQMRIDSNSRASTFLFSIDNQETVQRLKDVKVDKRNIYQTHFVQELIFRALSKASNSKKSSQNVYRHNHGNNLKKPIVESGWSIPNIQNQSKMLTVLHDFGYFQKFKSSHFELNGSQNAEQNQLKILEIFKVHLKSQDFIPKSQDSVDLEQKKNVMSEMEMIDKILINQQGQMQDESWIIEQSDGNNTQLTDQQEYFIPNAAQISLEESFIRRYRI